MTKCDNTTTHTKDLYGKKSALDFKSNRIDAKLSIFYVYNSNSSLHEIWVKIVITSFLVNSSKVVNY